MTRDQILQEIWGYEFDGENRTVDVHIRTLRTKLGEAGSLALRDTLAAEKNLRIELILVTDDGHVRYTAGLAERFEPSEEGTYVYEAIIA